MRFRLTTIAYVFAMLAVGMATFQSALGLVAGGIVLAYWALQRRKAERAGPVRLFIGLPLIVAATLWLLTAARGGQQALQRQLCISNIKQLGLAIQSYEAANGNFPPAITRDELGKPLHSWRTLILPHLNQRALSTRYRLNQPWNSPVNAQIASMSIPTYECPLHAHAAASTSYFAVVDPRTPWPPDRGLTYRELRDGASRTILLLEAPHKQTPWAKPEDLSFEEAVDMLTSRPKSAEVTHESTPGYFYKPVPGLLCVYADGHVGFVPRPLPRDTAGALLTASAGKDVRTDSMHTLVPPVLDHAKCYATALFVALTLLPAFTRRPIYGEELLRNNVRSPHFEHPLEGH
jgi:hypothetical protein